MVAGDQAVDLADCYFFKDPLDASKVVLLTTVRGFIVPGEAQNFGIFDAAVRYRFQIENSEDFRPDANIDVRFSEKNSEAAQTAVVTFSGTAFAGLSGSYKGTTTVATLGATVPATYFPAVPQKLKDRNNADIAVEFWAGEVDDPFFFDIPGFVRFREKVIASDATAADELKRGRDTFAGYNCLLIGLRMPITLLKSTIPRLTNATKFGLSVQAQRQTERTVRGRKVGTGLFTTVDRQGIPGINALIIPLGSKALFNGSTTVDDHNGKFVDLIRTTLSALKTSPANMNTIVGLAATNGDILRLNTSTTSAFPNGRKPIDDVVKTLLTIVSNANEATPATTLDDGVAANDKTFETIFPYVALPHQPLPRVPADPTLPDTNVDDKTRN